MIMQLVFMRQNTGLKMHRADWDDDLLINNINFLLNDEQIQQNLLNTSKFMQSDNGSSKAAKLILELA